MSLWPWSQWKERAILAEQALTIERQANSKLSSSLAVCHAEQRNTEIRLRKADERIAQLTEQVRRMSQR